MQMGAVGYRRFQQRLATEISPEEAEEAHGVDREGMRATWLLSGSITTAVVLMLLLIPDREFGWHEEVGDILDQHFAGNKQTSLLVDRQSVNRLLAFFDRGGKMLSYRGDSCS